MGVNFVCVDYDLFKKKLSLGMVFARLTILYLRCKEMKVVVRANKVLNLFNKRVVALRLLRADI